MNPRVKHVLGLLATIATAIGTIWVGTSTPVSTKIAQSLIVALALAFNKAKATQIEHAFLGFATVAGTVLSFIALKLPPHSAALAMVPTLIAVLTDLQSIITKSTAAPITDIPPSTKVVALLLAAGLSSFAIPAQAQTTAPAPQLGLRVGTWTIQPATAGGYELNLKTGDLNKIAGLIGVSAVTTQYSIPLGIGLYCGLGVQIGGTATPSPTTGQCALLGNVSNFAAAGAALQEFQDPTTNTANWQWLLFVGGNLNFAGTVQYLTEQVTVAVSSAAPAGK